MKKLIKKDQRKVLMATIDVGAHSARMLIAEVDTVTGDYSSLEDIEVHVPLGSNVFQHGRISDESIQILCDVFRNFKQKMDEYGILEYRAIATSAVREALNSEIFIERVWQATGLKVTIFEGGDEARLDYLAVRSDVPEKFGFTKKSTLIVDIGTGACQVSAYSQGRLCFTETIKVGTLRVFELMPNSVSGSGMSGFLTTLVDRSFSELEHISTNLRAETVIAMGASVRAILKLAQKKISPKSEVVSLTKDEFYRIHKIATSMSVESISEKYGIGQDIAETVVPCCLILANLFSLTGAGDIVIPMISTKNALLRDFINERVFGQDYFEPQVYEMIKKTAEKYCCSNKYSERVMLFAEELFLKLLPLHGLGHRDLTMLKIAACLHKAGLFINNQAYHKHSYYIILNTEIPGITPSERRIIALMARYHRKSYPKSLHVEYIVLNQSERNSMNKLAAMLRIACGLASFPALSEKIQAKIENDKVILKLNDETAYFTESMSSIDTDYFRYVFARKVIFK